MKLEKAGIYDDVWFSKFGKSIIESVEKYVKIYLETFDLN